MLTPLKLIQLEGQPAQLPGTEVSLFRTSYKQLIGQGKQHSIVSTTAPNILILLAKQSLMVKPPLNGPISEFGVQPAIELKIVPCYIVAAEQSEFYQGCTKNSLIGPFKGGSRH